MCAAEGLTPSHRHEISSLAPPLTHSRLSVLARASTTKPPTPSAEVGDTPRRPLIFLRGFAVRANVIQELEYHEARGRFKRIGVI